MVACTWGAVKMKIKIMKHLHLDLHPGWQKSSTAQTLGQNMFIEHQFCWCRFCCNRDIVCQCWKMQTMSNLQFEGEKQWIFKIEKWCLLIKWRQNEENCQQFFIVVCVFKQVANIIVAHMFQSHFGVHAHLFLMSSFFNPAIHCIVSCIFALAKFSFAAFHQWLLILHGFNSNLKITWLSSLSMLAANTHKRFL